jgi:LysM repeat protein
MNNQSPLVPQGSLLEQKNKGRARVKIAVFFVLALHGIGLLALLMQGCRKDEPQAQTEATNTIAAPTFVEPTNLVAADLNSQLASNNNLPPEATNAIPTLSDYAIAKGDTLSGIASNHKVTLRALMDANPGIEPTKLQLGQKIHIPPPSAPVANNTIAQAPTSVGEGPYIVKSGDTLSKIASDHRTTVRAIRAANNLKTDSIKVGQKLIIPKQAPTVATNGTP